MTPAETGNPHLLPGQAGRLASINSTSPGLTPAIDGRKRFSDGWNSGKCSFHTRITSCGVTLAPARRTLYVFCHKGPKPCIGLTNSRPSTLILAAPVGTSETFRRSIGRAQWPPWSSAGLEGGVWLVIGSSRLYPRRNKPPTQRAGARLIYTPVRTAALCQRFRDFDHCQRGSTHVLRICAIKSGAPKKAARFDNVSRQN